MGKKESLQTTPRLVKEVPKGYVEEIRDGKKVYVFKKETPIPKTPIPVKPKPTTSKPSGTPKRLPPPKPKPVEPDFKSEEDIVYLEEPVTQKRQSLRTDLKEDFPSGLEKGYHSYKVPDLTKGANYTNAKNVITDNEGMPVVFDFKQNKYIQTGEPNIHLNMPVQNDTPTIQAPLKTNELPTKFDAIPERLRAPSYNLPKVVTPTVDESIYKGFNNIGVEDKTKNNIEFQKEQEKNLANPKVRPLVTAPPMKKGGLVSEIKGYTNGGTTRTTISGLEAGVVGQNDQYSAQKAKEDQDAIDEEKKKANQQKARNVANKVGEGMGGVGSAYYNSQTSQNEGDAARNAGLAATSQMGGIGGMIGGLAAMGDKIGKPIKNKSEALDSSGNLKNSNKSKMNAIGGSLFSPSKALAYRSESGNWGDVTGNQYNAFIEGKAKAQLAEVKDANAKSAQQQAILARNNGEENPTITNPYNLTGVTFDENQNMILADGQQFDKNRPMMNKGGLVSKVKQMCADGGVIKGKGTGTSDSINAKVKANSFIVPAKNAHVAEELREKFLGKPPKMKANLNDKGGEQVKLSNGEHKFTPEEKEELMEKGVNVNLLAPNAEHKEESMEKRSHIMFPKVVGLATGGDVEEDTIDPIKELARLNKEKENAIKAGKVESDAAKAARDKKIADFNAKVASYDRKADRKSKAYEWEKKYNDSKTKLDALNKSYEEASKSFEAANTPTEAQKAKGIKAGALTETQRKYKESLLKKIQEAKSEFDNADRTYKYVKDDNNYDASGNIKVKSKTATVVPKTEVKPTVVAENVAPTKPSLKAPKVAPKTEVGKFVPTLTPYTSEEVVVPGDKLSPNERAIANADAEKATVQAAVLNKSLPQTVATNGTLQNQRRGLADVIGSVDPTAFVGIGQTALGLNMLGKEKRPIDNAKIDSTYNTAVNRAQQDALFGLTPEQKFMAEQDIQGGLNDAKMAGLNASGVQSFNLNRAAINDAWKNKLGLKQADAEMRMNKQKYADSMAADRANILSANRRQAFNDAMYTFQQKQQAGSELIGAGLANTIGAYRFKKDQQARDEANKASNAWTSKI